MVRAGLALICALATPVLASPRSDPTEGRAVFTGATVAGAESIDLNPAAIGPSFLNAIYFGASAVLDHYHVRVDSLDPSSGAITPGETVGDNEVAPGGLLAAIVHINDRATVGAELSSPPAESFIAGRNALSYFSMGGSQRTYRGGIAASFRVTNEFYFGVSLITDTAYLHLNYAVDTALANGAAGIASACGTSACGIGNSQAAEQFDVHVNSPVFSTANLVANIGVLISPYKDIWVGLAYHSPPGLDSVQTELDGTMDVTQAPRDGTNVLHGAGTVYISQPASVDLEVRARLPHQLDLHVAGRWEDLSRLSAYDVRGYGSLFPQYNVPEWTLLPQSFHDSFAFWGGVEQAETGQLARFGARLGYETASLDDDDTSPMVIAPRSYTADVGVQLRLALGITLQATYGVQYFPTVDVTKSAFDPRSVIDCIASDYNYATSACASTRNGYGIESADGSYQRWEQTFRVMLRRDL